MSCIPRLLELKGSNEILHVPARKNKNEIHGVVIEGGGKYRDYDFLITFNDIGIRCGYVALPPEYSSSKLECREYDFPDLDVHGGVTFFKENHLSEHFFEEDICRDKWLGFDCGHAGDLLDYNQALKYFHNNGSITDGIKSMLDLRNTISKELNDNPVIKDNSFEDEPRTFEYVTSECHRLIDQLIEYAA